MDPRRSDLRPDLFERLPFFTILAAEATAVSRKAYMSIRSPQEYRVTR